MSLTTHNVLAAAEFDAYYSSFDTYEAPLLALLRRELTDDLAAFEKKTRLYEILCRECPVHLFRETDFFFEMSSGRVRFIWGGLSSHVGGYLREQHAERWLMPYYELMKPDIDEGRVHCWANPVSFDHHCPGYDRLLELGLPGIIARAEKLLESASDEHAKTFLSCAVRANRALIGLLGRFGNEARRLAGEEAERAAHYEKIAAACEALSVRAPETFYEALCLILFYRECVGSIEGIGFSTFGQLDRMLMPFYERDLAAGRLTKDEALRYFCGLLVYTDARFDVNHGFHETSTTVELGGCDREGHIVYNALTELMLDAVIAVRSVNTKINCRVSKAHPKAYLEKIAKVQLENLPTLMLHNDDVLVASRVKRGQAIEDARMYVGGGCHEIVLQGTEVNSRADTWINLPRLLLDAMAQGQSDTDWETFYARFLDTVRAFIGKIVRAKNQFEAMWPQCDPLILYSSSLSDCLEKGRDLTEGGARYNSVALSMTGTATLIDSLQAVKSLVFDEKTLTMTRFLDILAADFEGEEPLRRTILTLPKHGTGDKDTLSAKTLHDLSELSGQTNARGGSYLPAFYPHEAYHTLGLRTGATPDGRKNGWMLSRGVSPSEFIEADPLDLIKSLGEIDFTDYAESFCCEVTLPRLPESNGLPVLLSLIEAFLENGGSSMQFNLLDPEELREAQSHPDRHAALSVRVCGYSARFVTLGRDVQDEVIGRAVR